MEAGNRPMKCPTCGFENPKSYGPCQRCGRFLGAFTMQKPAEQAVRAVGRDISYAARAREEYSHEEIAKRMRIQYVHGAHDPALRNLDGLLKLAASCRKKEVNIRALSEEAARFIHDQFRLRWVAIGSKSPRDGLFRYDALVGFREEAANARRGQAFSLADFTEDTKYKGRQISDISKMYFEEDKPYTEGAEVTFNRPVLLKGKRRAPDEALEGDYLDVHIYGGDGELIGWIETSGTVAGKLPDVTTIKTLELIASMLGLTFMRAKH